MLLPELAFVNTASELLIDLARLAKQVGGNSQLCLINAEMGVTTSDLTDYGPDARTIDEVLERRKLPQRGDECTRVTRELDT
jgi:hypothetical protein